MSDPAPSDTDATAEPSRPRGKDNSLRNFIIGLLVVSAVVVVVMYLIETAAA